MPHNDLETSRNLTKRMALAPNGRTPSERRDVTNARSCKSGQTEMLQQIFDHCIGTVRFDRLVVYVLRTCVHSRQRQRLESEPAELGADQPYTRSHNHYRGGYHVNNLQRNERTSWPFRNMTLWRSRRHSVQPRHPALTKRPVPEMAYWDLMPPGSAVPKVPSVDNLHQSVVLRTLRPIHLEIPLGQSYDSLN